MPARHTCLRVLLASLLVSLLVAAVCSAPFGDDDDFNHPNIRRPDPMPKLQPGAGELGGFVSRIPGAGYNVNVQGQKELWKSQDGNTRAGVIGSYDRIVSVSEEEFVSQVWQMQAAGSETSANMLTFALWELARNQVVQDKLRAEMKQALEKDKGEVEYQTVQDLPYLDSVVKEVLRRWPILPWLDRRCTKEYRIPSLDLTLEKGAMVLIPSYSHHHDPEIFPDPEKFDPDRWSAENRSDVHKQAYMPFGSGPRICIGARFGLMSIKSGLMHILTKYRVSLGKHTPRSPRELSLNTYSFLLLPGDKLNLVFAPLKG